MHRVVEADTTGRAGRWTPASGYPALGHRAKVVLPGVDNRYGMLAYQAPTSGLAVARHVGCVRAGHDHVVAAGPHRAVGAGHGQGVQLLSGCTLGGLGEGWASG